MKIITDNATLYMIICMSIVAGGIYFNNPMIIIVGLVLTVIGLLNTFNELYKTYYVDNDNKKESNE